MFAPLLFARAVFVPGAALRAALAALAFCFISSGVYVLNDWADRERDRLHPEKRHRPIAAGLISGTVAAAMVAACWAVGFTLALLARLELAELARRVRGPAASSTRSCSSGWSSWTWW